MSHITANEARARTSFEDLAGTLHAISVDDDEVLELSHALVIICPDCGKHVAHNNRCPKCGSASWTPAGNSGGIFEQLAARRRQEAQA